MWRKITEYSISVIPLNTVINTKIDDGISIRNEQELKFDGKLWWTPDGSMYVYYTPTHWKF